MKQACINLAQAKIVLDEACWSPPRCPYRPHGRMVLGRERDTECHQMPFNDHIIDYVGACKYQVYGLVMTPAVVPD